MAIKVDGMSPLFQVFDMPASLAFYRDLLGFEVIQDSGQGDNSGWVMLRLNGVYLMLNTQFEDEYRPASPDPARKSAHDDTCLYFSTTEVDAVYRYLKESGMEINEPNNAPYGMRQLYLRDPDGFNLCFQQPIE